MNSITSKPPLGFEVTETRTYFAGSAVVYRVSRTNRQAGKLSCGCSAITSDLASVVCSPSRMASGSIKSSSALGELGMLIWSYRKELQEHRAQLINPHTGQNVLICARKPTH